MCLTNLHVFLVLLNSHCLLIMGSNKQKNLSVFMFPPPLLSPLLHHTIPAGTNLRLTVYRRITRLHLSNLGPHLSPPPREGAMDQEKGRNGGSSEREKCARVPQDWSLSMWIRKRECDNRRGTAQTSLCVCMRLCVCAARVCLYGLRCHICEDHSFELVATRDDALNHRNAWDGCAVICVWMCVSFGTFDGD